MIEVTQVAGIFKKILYVDLTKGLIGEETLPLTWYKEFIGGQGVGLQYIFEDFRLKKPVLIDPVMIMTGPLTGSPIPATSKACIISCLEEQNELHLSSIEGKFPAYLKLAGFDGLVLTGRSEKPVALKITHKESRLVDAEKLWGIDVITTEQRIKEADPDLATLIIGPQGENRNPYATVVADQFINAGSGIGSHIGIKKLKAISVRADWELNIDSEMTDFSTILKAYIKRHFKKDPNTTNRRTCFGCLVGCGLFDTDQNFVMIADDIRHLENLLPGLSHDLLRGLCKECIQAGVDVFATASFLSDPNLTTITAENIADAFSKVKVSTDQNKAGSRWEDAQLATNQNYADSVFKYFQSCDGLVERENIAMVKNCLPVCHRWDMSLEDMTLFLNSITGFNFNNNDLLTVGEKMIDITMGVYNAIHYGPLEEKLQDYSSVRLPKLLAENINDYIKIRNWNESGYPSINRLKSLGVPNPILK